MDHFGSLHSLSVRLCANEAHWGRARLTKAIVDPMLAGQRRAVFETSSFRCPSDQTF